MDADGVAKDTDATLQRWLNLANDELAAGHPNEAKKLLTAAQRDLRAIKAEVLAAERTMRADSRDARRKADERRPATDQPLNRDHSGQLSRTRAAEKRAIAREARLEAQRFQIMKDAIDFAVHQLYVVKLDITAGKYDPDLAGDDSGAATAAATPLRGVMAPPPVPPPMWAPDPLGRFELRYWDGQRWTEHVSSSGQHQLDSDITS